MELLRLGRVGLSRRHDGNTKVHGKNQLLSSVSPSKTCAARLVGTLDRVRPRQKENLMLGFPQKDAALCGGAGGVHTYPRGIKYPLLDYFGSRLNTIGIEVF